LNLKELVSKAVEIYNSRRAPEAVAEVIEVKEDEVVVKFSGSFCMWCGVYDWVEDFKYVLEEVGVKSDLKEYIEPEDPQTTVRYGVFKIQSLY